MVSKLLRQVYSSQKLQTTFRKFYSRRTDLVHKFDTSVTRMLKSLYNNCDILMVSSYLRETWRVQHVEQEMLTISGTSDSDFTPFGECMISPFTICITEFASLCTMFTD